MKRTEQNRNKHTQMSTVDYKQGPASQLSYLLPRCWHRLHRCLQFRLTAACLWEDGVCVVYWWGETRRRRKTLKVISPTATANPLRLVSIVTRSAVSNYLAKQLASSSSLFSSAIVVVVVFVAVVCCAKKKRRKEREGGKEWDMYVVVSISERVGGSWWNQSSRASSGKDVVGCLFSSKPVVIIHRTPQAAAAK